MITPLKWFVRKSYSIWCLQIKKKMSYDSTYKREPSFTGAMHKISKEVTNVSKKLASDDTFRHIRDKAQAAITMDNLAKAAIKATSHEHGPPKEKHVQTLLAAVKDASTNHNELFNHLYQRLHDKDATVRIPRRS
jgi:hypothetical protein